MIGAVHPPGFMIFYFYGCTRNRVNRLEVRQKLLAKDNVFGGKIESQYFSTATRARACIYIFASNAQ